MDVIDWLLAGDPAVAWQARRDLLGQTPAQYGESWRQLGQSGWAAALLAQRAADGLWAQGWYSPKWTSTFYTLQTLGLLGLTGSHAPARASAELLLNRATSDGRAVGRTEAPASWSRDLCVAGMLVRTCVTFGLANDPRVGAQVAYILDHQLPDGGWNCRSTRCPVAHSSFHTTISVLEGLHHAGLAPDAQARGREFLLVHRLFRSHRTGAVVHPGLTSFSFPRYWYYDVLRALEHLAAAGAEPDPRLCDAIDLLSRRRRADGTWNLGRSHPGRTYLRMEAGGQPSRMITLSALRVLRWWNGGQPNSSTRVPAGHPATAAGEPIA